MGFRGIMPKLLIALPTKTAPHYADRMEACRKTWLSELPDLARFPHIHNNLSTSYKGFSDADLGLVEVNQHDNANDPIRTHRTKRMVQWAYDLGFDYIFRVDTDAYVWVNRLLKSGFENHDYMGWCLDVPERPGHPWCMNTAHGGIGFFLSRRAMKVVIDAPVEKYSDGKYWGDLWAGQALWRKGIKCHRDTRFLDGSGHPKHHGNIFVDELPANHQYIAIHPCPIASLHAIHDRFKNLPEATIAPDKQLWAA